jgi:hypothetical protein
LIDLELGRRTWIGDVVVIDQVQRVRGQEDIERILRGYQEDIRGKRRV